MSHLKINDTNKENKGKEKIYSVTNKNGEDLGYIEYFNNWKCWVYSPEPEIVMSLDCLKEVTEFLSKL